MQQPEPPVLQAAPPVQQPAPPVQQPEPLPVQQPEPLPVQQPELLPVQQPELPARCGPGWSVLDESPSPTTFAPAAPGIAALGRLFRAHVLSVIDADCEGARRRAARAHRCTALHV